jgi:hypothetical protein
MVIFRILQWIIYVLNTYLLGIQQGPNVFTIKGQIWLPIRYFGYDLVILHNKPTEVTIFRVLSFDVIVIKKHYIPLGYCLSHIVNADKRNINYFPNVPFHVNEGELVYSKKEYKRLGYHLKEISRSTTWPLSGVELYNSFE